MSPLSAFALPSDVAAHGSEEPGRAFPRAEDPEGSTERARQLSRLRSEITRLQRPRGDSDLLPLAPELTALLPGGGLRVGSAYSLAPAAGLIGALLAPPSQQGAWCAVVGMPALGIEALAGLGVDLSRVVLVPDPGTRWLGVVSALAEVFPLLAVHPPHTASEAEASRIHARLRVQRSTLLVTAPWPQSEARLSVEQGEWQGLGTGWGLLSQRVVTIRAEAPQGVRRARVLLPGPEGVLAPLGSGGATTREAQDGWRSLSESGPRPGEERLLGGERLSGGGRPGESRRTRSRLRPVPFAAAVSSGSAPAPPSGIRVAG